MSGLRGPESLGAVLERVYAECHRVELIDPDPLLVVREYPDPRDREIAALFCASFALGRARSIVAACKAALAPLGPHPAAFLASSAPGEVLSALGGFSYRFFDTRDAACLLSGASRAARDFGSLEAAFSASARTPAPVPGADPEPGRADDSPLLARCDLFVDRIRGAASRAADELPPGAGRRIPGGEGKRGGLAPNLLPAPRDGSACKRLMLFLRWMVRSDGVDPGGWTSVSPSELILPLDVHLHRISRALGLISRRSPDLRAALEATEALRRIDPDDPVRFDFALARLGIRSDYSLNLLYTP